MRLDDERKSADQVMDNLVGELISSEKGKELLRALIEKVGVERLTSDLKSP